MVRYSILFMIRKFSFSNYLLKYRIKLYKYGAEPCRHRQKTKKIQQQQKTTTTTITKIDNNNNNNIIDMLWDMPIQTDR